MRNVGAGTHACRDCPALLRQAFLPVTSAPVPLTHAPDGHSPENESRGKDNLSLSLRVYHLGSSHTYTQDQGYISASVRSSPVTLRRGGRIVTRPRHRLITLLGFCVGSSWADSP